jgi:parvulin-like peptidyl-prolyl isomerase
MNGRKWTVGGLTGTLALLCATGGALAQQKEANPPAAIVNGEVISKGELDALLKKIGPMAGLTTQLRQQGRSLSDFCREMNKSEAQVRADVAAIVRWYAYAEKHITEQDLERCYQANKDLFDQIRVRVSEIVQRLPTQAEPSERELARKRLQELRDKILANQIPFEEAARQFSQSSSKDQGGDIDWLPHLRGGLYPLLPQHIVDIAFGMQPGQVSDVLDSEFGLYLIKVTQRDPGHPSEYAKVKESVRDLCVEEMKMAILSQQRKSAEVRILLQ